MSCQRRCSASVCSDRISLARPRSLEMRRPLSLLSLRDSFPSPARGEGLGTGDLPRLSRFIERNKREFALGHDGFKVTVTLAGDRLGFEAHRGAALFQQLDVDTE